MLTVRRTFLFASVFIFINVLNLLFIGNSKAEPPLPFMINGPSQMSINQIATLSVFGGCGGPYFWEINSGGGSLSSSTGTSVNYTSPSSNPNCDLNPLISVTDKAGQIVYKSITVNATCVNSTQSECRAYKIWWRSTCLDMCSTAWYHKARLFLSRRSVYCCGDYVDSTTAYYIDYACGDPANPVQACENAWNAFMPSDADIYPVISKTSTEIVQDYRNDPLKTSGCCPPGSASASPPPVTVNECTTCDLKINKFDGSNTIIDPRNGGRIIFEAEITSSQPFTWTLTISGGVSGIAPIHGSGNPGSISWNGKDANGDVVPPGSYTATLSAQEIDDPTCRNSNNKSFKVAAREKDCKLDVSFDSSLNIASGNLSHSQNLFTVPNSSGLMPDFTLYYNSMEGYNGVLGKGWTHTYNVFISTDPTDDAYILSDDRGGMISLYRNGDYYTSDISAYPMLQVNTDGTFTLLYKNGMVYSFNTNGKLTAITDRNGNQVNLTYSAGSNLVSITDLAGRAIYLSYAGNRISAITDPNNNSYAFSYSGDTLTSVSSHSSLGTQTWHYTYDGEAFMLTKTDPQGNLVRYSYDAEHRVTQAIDPQGYARNIQYDPENNTTTIIEQDGGAWTYKYDPVFGALTSKTDPSGATTYYQYDSNRNLTGKTEPDGTATNYTYDQNGNMTSVTDALNNTTTYAYNDQNKVISITDAAGSQTSYTYDDNGNVTSTTDPSGATTRYTFDSRGNIITITDPAGGVTQMAYDSNHNLISMTSPTGQTTSQTYDNLGNMISQTDATGNKTTFQYNSLNQLIAVTDSAGQTSRYTHDANGNRLSVTDANGNTTTYEYNYKNQLIKMTDALSEKTTFTYGAGGCSTCGGGSDKLATVTDAKNHTTTYQYDQTGRLIKETDPQGNFTTYTYDAKGNVISKTKPDGRTINYIYDALNRLVERNYPDGTSDIFEYDQSGNLTGAANPSIVYYYSYDADNRVTGVTSYNLAQLFNIEYQYDIMGNRTKMTMKEGTGMPKTINYYYNANNQMTKIVSDMGSFTFAYDSLGRRIKRTLPNDTVTSYSYDQLSRLTNITHKNAFHQTIDSFAYTHDPVGNRLTQTIKENIPHTMNYTYDKVYRLAKASPFSRNKLEKLFDDIVHHHTEAYSYDPVGNRQTGPDKFDSYTYNDGNELLTSTEHPHQKTQNEYDANGNLIKKMETVGKWKTITSYAYDDENRLIDVTIRKGDKIKAVSFAYDPFGRRISKTTEREELDDDNNIIGQLLNKPDYPRTTFYIYDQQNIITEYDGNGKQTAFYIHGPNIDEPLAAEINNTRIYYHADGLGSITTLTNHMGHKVQEYDYDSFGNIKSTPFWIKQPFTYTGREYDSETNLYYYRARYYDSNAGRFITRDPIGFNSGEMNLYNYVDGNSVNKVDPLGLYETLFGYTECFAHINKVALGISVLDYITGIGFYVTAITFPMGVSTFAPYLVVAVLPASLAYGVGGYFLTKEAKHSYVEAFEEYKKCIQKKKNLCLM